MHFNLKTDQFRFQKKEEYIYFGVLCRYFIRKVKKNNRCTVFLPRCSNYGSSSSSCQIKFSTDGEGAEHVLERLGQLLVAPVHLEVHFAQVGRAVQAHLHERGTAACRRRGLVAVGGGGVFAGALVGLHGHDVLPERPDGWPSHHLSPAGVYLCQNSKHTVDETETSIQIQH